MYMVFTTCLKIGIFFRNYLHIVKILGVSIYFVQGRRWVEEKEEGIFSIFKICIHQLKAWSILQCLQFQSNVSAFFFPSRKLGNLMYMKRTFLPSTVLEWISVLDILDTNAFNWNCPWEYLQIINFSLLELVYSFFIFSVLHPYSASAD